MKVHANAAMGEEVEAPCLAPAVSGEATHQRSVFLHPGRAFVSTEGAPILTILGSCVAVCLWDDVAGIGGMIHFALPHAGTAVSADADAMRFGDTGIQATLGRIVQGGGELTRIRSKIFGGAGVLRGPGRAAKRLGVQNAEVAMRSLLDLNIPIVVSETGGGCGRKVLFHPRDGSAWVKQIER